MKYKVYLKKSALKNLTKLPKQVQKAFMLLHADLEEGGPNQYKWPNYSKLGGDKYHCHLNYRYVACWKCQKDVIEIEVYYVGSREKAPY